MWPTLIIAALVLALAIVHASWRRRFERLQNEVRARLESETHDSVKQLAEGLHQLRGFPPNVNWRWPST